MFDAFIHKIHAGSLSYRQIGSREVMHLCEWTRCALPLLLHTVKMRFVKTLPNGSVSWVLILVTMTLFPAYSSVRANIKWKFALL